MVGEDTFCVGCKKPLRSCTVPAECFNCHTERLFREKLKEEELKEEERRVEPITPEQAEKQAEVSIPPEVIDVFNKLIIANYRNGEATVKQSEAVEAIKERLGRCDSKLLDVEDIFRKAGWRVTYDAPAYPESYPATFKFQRPPRGGSSTAEVQ